MHTDIVILGAGPVGGALACRLAAEGLSVAVIDTAALPPMEHPDFDGRAYAVAAGSRRFLDLAGLWDTLAPSACPIEHIRVSDGKLGRRASRLHLHFDRADAAEPFGWMVEARNLRVALNGRLNTAPNLHLFAPSRATAVRGAGGALVRVEGGPAISCALVIGAEGRNSPSRAEAGIPVTSFVYRQASLVCAIAHERPHHGVALEHFLPDGPFAQLPMSGTDGAPNVSAVVWSDDARRAERLLALPDEALARALARRLGGHLGAVRMVGRRWLYPLGALHAHRTVATRLALVGDAAHGIHPIAGQGLNLGFRDAAALAGRLVAAHWAGRDLGDPALLRAYQAARRPANLAMLFATDALDRLFSNDLPPIRLARDLGIATVGRLAPLRRAFVRQAMGVG